MWRCGVVVRQQAVHPKIPSSNLVRTINFLSLATGAVVAAAALCDNIYGWKPEDKHIFYNSENVVHFLLRPFTLARIYRAPYRFDGD